MSMFGIRDFAGGDGLAALSMTEDDISSQWESRFGSLPDNETISQLRSGGQVAFPEGFDASSLGLAGFGDGNNQQEQMAGIQSINPWENQTANMNWGGLTNFAGQGNPYVSKGPNEDWKSPFSGSSYYDQGTGGAPIDLTDKAKSYYTEVGGAPRLPGTSYYDDGTGGSPMDLRLPGTSYYTETGGAPMDLTDKARSYYTETGGAPRLPGFSYYDDGTGGAPMSFGNLPAPDYYGNDSLGPKLPIQALTTDYYDNDSLMPKLPTGFQDYYGRQSLDPRLPTGLNDYYGEESRDPRLARLDPSTSVAEGVLGATGNYNISPTFGVNPTINTNTNFANMFAGFDPFKGMDLGGGAGGSATGGSATGGVGMGGTGGVANVTNLFGDRGIFGGNPLLGSGAVTGGNVDFGEHGIFGKGGLGLGDFAQNLGLGNFGLGLGDFGQGIGTGLEGLGAGFGNAMSGIGTGLEGIGGGLAGLGSGLATMNKGMFAPGSFQYQGPDMSNMNTGLLGEGAITINEGVPDWVTNPNQIFQNISPLVSDQIRSMMPGEEELMPEWARGGEQAFLDRIMPQLFPEGSIEESLKNILGDPLDAFRADIEDLRSGGLLAELNKLQDIEAIGATDGEGGEAGEFSMTDGDYFMDAPQLDMPAITDYSQALQMPMYDNIIKSLDTQNPYDKRRDDILGGQNEYLDKIYDEKRANLENRFAVMDNLGSPGFREAMKDLEEDRAMAKLGVTSQFGQQAAATDESTRRGRVADLASSLGFETGRVRDEMNFQNQLQQQSDQGFNNYMDQIFRSHMAPQDSYDNALRMMLGGLGTAIQPNIGAAVTGLGNNAQQYQNKMDQNTRNAQMMMNPGAFGQFERG